MEPEVERLILTEMERQSREIASLTAKVDRLKSQADQDFAKALAPSFAEAMENVRITANRINDILTKKDEYSCTIRHDKRFPGSPVLYSAIITEEEYDELYNKFIAEGSIKE